MEAKTFFLVAGVIFAVVALFHLVRIVMDWSVIIGDWSIPTWVSWVALIVAGGLSPAITRRAVSVGGPLTISFRLVLLEASTTGSKAN